MSKRDFNIICEICGFKSKDENKFKATETDRLYCLGCIKKVELGTVFTGEY